jgi:hypothetical protein
MSAYQFDEFERRMRRINRRHSKLSHGFVTQVTDDGLVVAKPRRRRGYALLRGIYLLLLVMFIFKGFLHANLGPLAYQERVDSLMGGNVIEQVGGFAMKADPVTLWLSGTISSLVR